MGQIICLANSHKEDDRCIAGIDVNTGEWIRPISSLENGAITEGIRKINGEEPQILDVLEIPFNDDGPDYGFQPENKSLKSGCWKKIGQITPQDLLDYCEKDSIILHNHENYVPFNDFAKIPKQLWKSLQLVRSKKVTFKNKVWGRRVKWRINFRYGLYRHMDIPVTDPVLLNKLDKGEEISNDCILTISLGMPFAKNKAGPQLCYKLLAGVVEL
jgi:hypothetical protein